MNLSPKITFFLAVALLLFVGPARSEVAVEISGGAYRGFVMIAPWPEPDPWPLFTVIRQDIASNLPLNPYGNPSTDGRPESAVNPATGYPDVVWSWYDGHDWEIVLSRWNGAAWTDRQLLTDNDVDDIDPMIVCRTDGSCGVVYWRSGQPGHSFYMEAPAPGSPGPEEQVSVVIDGGSRPSIADVGGVTRVAYQVEAAGVTQVVAAKRAAGGWDREIIHQTSYRGPADDGNIAPQIHYAAGKVWVDWLNAVGEMAYRTQDPVTGVWSDVQTEAYSTTGGDSESFAQIMARHRIRLHIVAPH